MSDTPQVDALDFGDQSRFPGPGYGDLWELARNLEREHAALREALERFAKEWRFLIDIGQLADHGELAQAEAALAGNPCNKSGGVSDAEVNARLTGVREGLEMAQGILWSTPCHATGKAAQSARDTLRSAVAERLRFAFEKAAGEALHEVPDSGSAPDIVQFQVWNDEDFVVQVDGPRDMAWPDALHYASQCKAPIIEEVTRRVMPLPERLHGSVPPSREDYALHSELNKTYSSEKP